MRVVVLLYATAGVSCMLLFSCMLEYPYLFHVRVVVLLPVCCGRNPVRITILYSIHSFVLLVLYSFCSPRIDLVVGEECFVIIFVFIRYYRRQLYIFHSFMSYCFCVHLIFIRSFIFFLLVRVVNQSILPISILLLP